MTNFFASLKNRHLNNSNPKVALFLVNFYKYWFVPWILQIKSRRVSWFGTLTDPLKQSIHNSCLIFNWLLRISGCLMVTTKVFVPYWTNHYFDMRFYLYAYFYCIDGLMILHFTPSYRALIWNLCYLDQIDI